MKRLLFILIVFGAIIMPSRANGIFVNDVTIAKGGQKVIQINYEFDKSDVYVGYLFSLELPNGISTVKDEDGLPIYSIDETNNKFSLIVTDNDGFSALPKSTSVVLNGNSGNLLSLTLQADESIESGSTHVAKLKNIQLTENNNGELISVHMEDVTFQITIEDDEAVVNNLIVDDFEIPQGGQKDFTVNYEFEKSDAYVGYLFTIETPSGISTVKDEDGIPLYTIDDNNNKFTIIATDNDGFSALPKTTSTTINGHSGTLLTLTLHADESLEVGSTHTVTIKNIQLTEKDEEGALKSVYLNNITFQVTIGEPINDFVILDEKSESIPEMSDGEVNIKVIRTIKAGEWSTICLPFSMTEEQTKQVFGDDVLLAEFVDYVEEYDINDHVTGMVVNFNLSDLTEGFYGNYPYLIKTSKNINEFYVNAAIDPDEEGTVEEYDNGKKGKQRVVYGSFIGTYHAGTVIPRYDLFLYDNKFYYSGGRTNMLAFRAYFSFVDILADVSNAKQGISISLDEPTNISLVNGEKHVGQDIYDLQGRKVHVIPSTMKGVYIVNGKKIIR